MSQEKENAASPALQPAATPNVGEGSAAEAYVSCAGVAIQPAAAPCKLCGATTAQACNDKGCFYLESGEGEPPVQATHTLTDERISFSDWARANRVADNEFHFSIWQARASSANETGAEGATRGPCICQEDLGNSQGTCIWSNGRAPCAAPAQAAEPVAIPAGWLTEDRISEIAYKCEVECHAIPGTNMWQCAHMAVEETIRALAEPHLSTWVAEVCEDADGYKHIESVIEDLGDLPKGMKLYASPQLPAQADARDYAMGHRDGWNECLEAQASQADAREGLTDDRIAEIYRECRHPTVGWANRFARAIERTLLAAHPGQPEPRADVTSVQWWLAELDQHGNPKLSDGAHSERAGADKAMYLIKNLGLDNKGKRWAVARVELSEPQPSADGVNHDAVSACRAMVDARAGEAS